MEERGTMKNWIFVGRSLKELFKDNLLKGLLNMKYVFLVMYEVSSELYSNLLEYLKEESPHSVYVYDISNIIRAEYPPKTKFFPEDSESPWVSLRIGKISSIGDVKIAEGLIYSDRIIIAFTSSRDTVIFPEDLNKYLFKTSERLSKENLEMIAAFYRPDLTIAELKFEEKIYAVSNNRNVLSFFEALIYKLEGISTEKIQRVLKTASKIDMKSLDVLGDNDLIEKLKTLIEKEGFF